MSLTFTVRHTDVDLRYMAFKRFVEFKNELVTWDMGPLANDGQAISSATGAAGSWAQLFGITAANYGNSNVDDGNGMAVYKKNLFIALYRSDTTNPKVIKYDKVDGSITKHLVNPQAGGANNYMGADMVVWNRSLWIITDVTAGVSDRRVVYYYDGTSWTAITNYAGATYLTYNRVDGSSPTQYIKHRTSRLFVFNGELYFIASRYSSTTSKWAWEIWKFDAVNNDRFALLYDSEAFDDGYVLSAILEKDGMVYLIGNTIAANGLPQNAAKLYSSPDMLTWTAGATFATLGWPYGEKIYDGRIYLNCINVATNRTQIKYIDEDLLGFTQEQEIVTNTNARGGGMESFLDDLNIGKYKEIWAAPGPAYKQTRTKAESLVGMEMTFVDKLGVETVRRYAPIDTRGPTRFYSGKIRSLSSVQRSVDDITGLFRIADMSVVLDNTDMEFSIIFAGTEYLKNQVAKLFHFWADEPERLRQHIISLIVEDHSMKGTAFNVKLKDITQKYFDIKVPTSICTAEDYPDIHPDYEGLAQPEVLGIAEWSAGEDKGAVKAIYVDTTGPPWRYLASRGQLKSIDNVYVDNVEKFVGGGADQYTAVLGTPSYIHINQDRGTATISFNATGYSHGAWDSAAGYVQNPAYIILYFLRFIMGIPFALLNVASFDTLATIYDNKGVGTNGKLILQRRNDAIEILRQLLFTFGAKGFVAKDGKFKVERKDISNYATNTFIFDQIDAMDKAERKWGLTKAMNVSKDRFDYIPWLRLFKSAVEASRATFPESIEDDRPLHQEDLPI